VQPACPIGAGRVQIVLSRMGMTDRWNDLRNRSEPSAELRPDASGNELLARGAKSKPGDAETRRQLAAMTKDEIARVPVLEPGARLEQGSVYLDLDDVEAGPFVALGSEVIDRRDRIVAKRDLDHEIWNRLAGDRTPRDLKPG